MKLININLFQYCSRTYFMQMPETDQGKDSISFHCLSSVPRMKISKPSKAQSNLCLPLLLFRLYLLPGILQESVSCFLLTLVTLLWILMLRVALLPTVTLL